MDASPSRNEALVVDIDEAHVGAVMEKLQTRRGEMTDMVNPGSGRVRIEFKIPHPRPLRHPHRVPHRNARHGISA